MKETLLQGVRQAGRLLLARWGRAHGVRRKGTASDVVTEADLASERLLTDWIRRCHPDHNLLSEESGLEHRGSEFTWVIDPLDGTSNFAAGLPWFGVMVAVLQQTTPVLAAMYLPVPDTLYVAERGHGASCNDRPVHLSPDEDLSDVLVACGLDATADEPALARQTRLLALLVQGARNVRLTNSLVDFAYTLDGHLGACVNPHCMIWDIAPACLLFPEARGRFTDLRGEAVRLELHPAHYRRSYGVVGGPPVLHSQVLRLAKQAGF